MARLNSSPFLNNLIKLPSIFEVNFSMGENLCVSDVSIVVTRAIGPMRFSFDPIAISVAADA